ncbi:hypothetical protein A3A60_02245 [Candidatus Curtissbacteria bacterium RIFCSPLOWO2_01_FULL_42_26]|uniref:Uncharacterized protein n=1 Tax=Candidatus Curtissbacteria bacterium RIFCSPLOWO2_01_FULL_42_26 TaxID=1797729 RepID=A0A1F5HYW1_9BACT|nr:MAG: hypothetical protein A3A60_02245 [Candidatus Curtissbacteria bacterium RIFCSPLOWO2_01_FULL_42_26]
MFIIMNVMDIERSLSPEVMQRIRDSVSHGVKTVVKPAIENIVIIDGRERLPSRQVTSIGGWGDPYCHPELQDGQPRIISKSFVNEAA